MNLYLRTFIIILLFMNFITCKSNDNSSNNLSADNNNPTEDNNNINPTDDNNNPTDDSNIINPNQVLIDSSECKNSISKVDLNDVQLDNDCINFKYNQENKILTVYHINAAFNCCPDSLIADISIDNDIINITELEKFNNSWRCNCLCIYDIEYRFENILPNLFTVNIFEPYLNFFEPYIEEDEKIQFVVDFGSNNSGNYCFDRTRYPWVIEK